MPQSYILGNYRKRIYCAHFGGRVEARAEMFTNQGWEQQSFVEAPTAQEAVRQLIRSLPAWQGAEVRHISVTEAA